MGIAVTIFCSAATVIAIGVIVLVAIDWIKEKRRNAKEAEVKNASEQNGDGANNA